MRSTDCGVRPRCPITGISASRSARIAGTRFAPPSSFTASAPASRTNRAALRTRVLGPQVVRHPRHVDDSSALAPRAPDGARVVDHVVHRDGQRGRVAQHAPCRASRRRAARRRRRPRRPPRSARRTPSARRAGGRGPCGARKAGTVMRRGAVIAASLFSPPLARSRDRSAGALGRRAQRAVVLHAALHLADLRRPARPGAPRAARSRSAFVSITRSGVCV